MPSTRFRRRDAARLASARSARPRVEGLEDRFLLATSNGGHWSFASRITYSFVPDGTSIGGISSNLFQSLNARFPTATWQQAFQKAAAIWEQVANINLAQVSDDGSPIGASGYQQGDPRFGDIRIGAYAQQNGQLGVAFTGPPVNGGTAAGDVFLNSSIAWQINNDYDLTTVAIHELGHALGLGHSSIQQADMYAYYTTMKPSLNGDDVTGIQAIYGGVPGDSVYNDTAGAAFNVTPYLDSQGQAAIPGQVVSSASDYDWFKVTVPSTTTGTMTVRMQSSNLSSLSPRIAIYNSSLAGVGQAVAANVYGATATYTVGNVGPGQVFYIRASAGNTGPGSAGAYGLLVNFSSTAQAAVAPPNTTVAAQPDQGGGSTAMKSGGTSCGGLLNLCLNVNLLGIDLSINLLRIGTLSVYGESLSTREVSGKRAPRPHHKAPHGHAHTAHHHAHLPQGPGRFLLNLH